LEWLLGKRIKDENEEYEREEGDFHVKTEETTIDALAMGILKHDPCSCLAEGGKLDECIGWLAELYDWTATPRLKYPSQSCERE
jgi:hypothetical protein